MAHDADVRDVPTDDLDALVALALEEHVDVAIVGPEAPLVAGLADRLRAAGVATVGPSAAAAALEGSKAFAKDVMVAAGVATARSVTVTDAQVGLREADTFGYPVAIKADGLASGKGVVIAASRREARDALVACLDARVFGVAGDVVVVEEGLVGREVSLIALSDGSAVARFPAARDYKPIGDGNTGPNTGGMGSVSPVPDIPDALADRLVDAIHRPVIAELARRGIAFNGVLYAGIMMTSTGPRVLEFNVRFGDPETQALLPRLEEDALELMLRVAKGTLADEPVRVRPGACVAVVLAAAGYPGEPRMGDVIHGLDRAAELGADVLHAGTRRDRDGNVVTAGGRVLAVAANGATVDAARQRAYAAADMIRFQGRQMRSDIAAGLSENAQ
ncbi:MAG: phosphoribosylamine--glycine ligase [Actinobacteria bacterium]|nr:phosphoribosylamine--glycine ligase [Actinomycetota bacterium]